jgi:hypothetical protein
MSSSPAQAGDFILRSIVGAFALARFTDSGAPTKTVVPAKAGIHTPRRL